MSTEFDPGPVTATFRKLCEDAPGIETYPVKDFRVEWGPVFHRGRLDGTAKVLIIGQDPAQHETICRRILVGEAGQRLQGFLAKAGISKSYVMINTFLFSVYGQQGGERHKDDVAIKAYRDQWITALLKQNPSIDVVIPLGTLAKHAWDWNLGLDLVDASLSSTDVAAPSNNRYGKTLKATDVAAIPAADLPAGSPSWMRSLTAWATRSGKNANEKRATIVVSIPQDERPF